MLPAVTETSPPVTSTHASSFSPTRLQTTSVSSRHGRALRGLAYLREYTDAVYLRSSASAAGASVMVTSSNVTSSTSFATAAAAAAASSSSSSSSSSSADVVDLDFIDSATSTESLTTAATPSSSTIIGGRTSSITTITTITSNTSTTASSPDPSEFGHNSSRQLTPSLPPCSPPQQDQSAVSRQLRTTSPLNNTASNSWIPTVSGVSGLSRVVSPPSAELSISSVHATNVSSTSRQPSDPVRSIEEAMSREQVATSLMSTHQPIINSNHSSHHGRTVNSGADHPQPFPSIRFTPHIDVRATRESLHFSPIERSLRAKDERIRVGRYSERDGGGLSAPVGFKSKVVSRRHCEFWCDGGQWYVKDVKSSSGTFLNHIRLSPPGVESRAYPINDGDILQLGIDFKGGEEQIFRCVKIRVELNRAWQKALNNFNMSAHRRLRNLANSGKDNDASLNSSECVICLLAISPCQCLFVAPCSHVWHYKCIRPLVEKEYPTFLCPNCRAIADLECDIEDEEPGDEVWETLPQDPGERTQMNNSQSPTSAVGVGEATTATTAVSSADAVISAPSTTSVTNPIRSPVSPIRPSSNRPPHSVPPTSPMILTPISNPPTIPLPPLPSPTEAQSLPTTHHRNVGAWRGFRHDNSVRAIAVSPRRVNDGSSDNGSANSSGGDTGHEGPMTPMNDAGPFVLDGGDRSKNDRRQTLFMPLD